MLCLTGTTSSAQAKTWQSESSGEATKKLAAAPAKQSKGTGVLAPLSTPPRTLQFPTYSCGGLIICNGPQTSFHNDNSNAPTARAQGQVSIPANKYVVFVPNGYFFQKPQALNNLPPNAFDGIVFRFMSMTDADEGNGDRGLQALSRFTGLRSIDCEAAEISDRGLSFLKSVSSLEFVNVSRTGVNGQFLKDMSRCKQLKVVDLHGCVTTAAGLKYLPAIEQLQRLSLSQTTIDSNSIKPLAQCKNLTILDLCRNKGINDMAIATIAAIKRLQVVNIAETSISPAGLHKLAAAKPKLAIQGQPDGSPAGKKAKQPRAENQTDIENILQPVSTDRGL